MIFNVNSGAGKIPINVIPSTNSSFTYDGEAKSPVWQNFDAQQLTISGADSAVNAGTYTVYFTPKADYEWWDGTSVPKEVSWSIAKAAGSLELSATSGTITGKNSGSKTFTVTHVGDGAVSVESSNTSVATASVSGTTVTVTPKGYGTATITVAVAEGTNHTAPGSKTYTITVQPLYLYNNGYAISGLAFSADYGVVSWNSTSFTCKLTHDDQTLKAFVTTQYDLTNYTKFVMKWNGLPSSTSFGLAVWKNGSMVSDVVSYSASGTVSLDISKLSGKYDLCIRMYSSTANKSANVTYLALE